MIIYGKGHGYSIKRSHLMQSTRMPPPPSSTTSTLTIAMFPFCKYTRYSVYYTRLRTTGTLASAKELSFKIQINNICACVRMHTACLSIRESKRSYNIIACACVLHDMNESSDFKWIHKLHIQLTLEIFRSDKQMHNAHFIYSVM